VVKKYLKERAMRRQLYSVTSLALLFLILTSNLVFAQNKAGITPDRRKKIEKAITSIMARDNIPGLSVAVVTNNQLRWANGYGLADLENNVPARSSTVYRLGSISKPITAVAVMQLAEQDKLDLDAPIQKYCPAFPKKQWPITTRQLLGHLAGIRHYHESGDDFQITRHYDNLVDALEIFKDDPLLHEPGSKFFYSSYGYNLLGCIVEGASAMKFTDYVDENIFKPSKMDRIQADNIFEIIPNRAQGYQKSPNGELKNSGLVDSSYKIPSGGFCSTVEDIARFAIALQTGLLVKPETLNQMWTKQKTNDGKETDYGLGWSLSERNGEKVVSHSGGQQRVTTYLYMLPGRKSAVVIMANLESANGILELAPQIADIFQ
jgi:serine beta-lactamase-like protein LACTB, mitochondrial